MLSWVRVSKEAMRSSYPSSLITVEVVEFLQVLMKEKAVRLNAQKTLSCVAPDLVEQQSPADLGSTSNWEQEEDGKECPTQRLQTTKYHTWEMWNVFIHGQTCKLEQLAWVDKGATVKPRLSELWSSKQFISAWVYAHINKQSQLFELSIIQMFLPGPN